MAHQSLLYLLTVAIYCDWSYLIMFYWKSWFGRNIVLTVAIYRDWSYLIMFIGSRDLVTISFWRSLFTVIRRIWLCFIGSRDLVTISFWRSLLTAIGRIWLCFIGSRDLVAISFWRSLFTAIRRIWLCFIGSRDLVAISFRTYGGKDFIDGAGSYLHWKRFYLFMAQGHINIGKDFIYGTGSYLHWKRFTQSNPVELSYLS